MSKQDQKGQSAMAWLHVPGYMIAWLENEYGGSRTYHGHKLLYLNHVAGVKKVWRLQADEDLELKSDGWHSLSALRMDVLQAGVKLNAETMEKRFHVPRGRLEEYVAVECPKTALTAFGVLRPWTRFFALSPVQARELCNILRREFWTAVAAYNAVYAERRGGQYPAVEMVEAFCDDTGTKELFIPEIRREWQRKEKARKGRGE